MGEAPLAGVVVLDLTTFLSGPLATRALADLGADVIKVEPPRGDPTRAGWTGAEGEPSPFWLALHRGRRSVVLDLTTEAGHHDLLRLAAGADVLVDNYRPGVTDRLGISPAVLRAVNPRLVTCSITGFGPDGPMADTVATDGPVQAFTGALALSGELTGVALPMALQVADLCGGATAAQGVLAALLARERTGRGAHVEVNLAESLLQWLAVADRSGTTAPPTTVVLTASDGGRFLVQTPLHFAARLLELVGAVDGCAAFAADSRWATPAGRASARQEYEDGLQRAAATATRDDWLARLAAAGIPAAPVHSFDQAIEHPQLVGRNAVGTLGGRPVVRPPWTLDGERVGREASLPPRLGEHTDAVLGRL